MLLLNQDLKTATAALLVGLIWGSTNPFIRRGSLAVESAQAQQHSSNKQWQAWLTPALLLPWLCNQLGSVLFVVLLGQADISMAVPVANAISIAANAVVRSAVQILSTLKNHQHCAASLHPDPKSRAVVYCESETCLLSPRSP